MNQDLRKIEGILSMVPEGAMTVYEAMTQIEAVVEDAKAEAQAEAVNTLTENLTGDFCDDIFELDALANPHTAFETYIFENVEKLY